MPQPRCDRCRKVPHADRAAAVAHMKWLKRRGARALNVYQCGPYWHVGHVDVAFRKRQYRTERGG